MFETQISLATSDLTWQWESPYLQLMLTMFSHTPLFFLLLPVKPVKPQFCRINLHSWYFCRVSPHSCWIFWSDPWRSTATPTTRTLTGMRWTSTARRTESHQLLNLGAPYSQTDPLTHRTNVNKICCINHLFILRTLHDIINIYMYTCTMIVGTLWYPVLKLAVNTTVPVIPSSHSPIDPSPHHQLRPCLKWSCGSVSQADGIARWWNCLTLIIIIIFGNNWIIIW